MPDAVAEIRDDGLFLRDCLSQRFCNQLVGAGSMSEGRIDPLEGAYQVAKGRLEVEGVDSGWVGALEVARRLLRDVDLFLVYYDLRRRGRRVRRGVRPRTLIVSYSGRRMLEVLVLSEGRPTSVRRIVEWSKAAAKDDYEPIIAVVDDYGIVTYYSARASSSLA